MRAASFTIAILLAGIVPCLSAQRVGPHFGLGANFARLHSAFSQYGGYSAPFFYPLTDSLYADYLSSGYPVASQPPIIFMQTPQLAGSSPVPSARPVQPLMIELQDGRYVRVSAEEEEEKQQKDGFGVRTQAAHQEGTQPPDLRTQAAAPDLPAVVLVFRDGHREEAPDYTIASGTLYVRSNYYIDGSWTRPIDLASLNLQETIASNQSRGVSFRLPAASNEVTVGP